MKKKIIYIFCIIILVITIIFLFTAVLNNEPNEDLSDSVLGSSNIDQPLNFDSKIKDIVKNIAPNNFRDFENIKLVNLVSKINPFKNFYINNEGFVSAESEPTKVTVKIIKDDHIYFIDELVSKNDSSMDIQNFYTTENQYLSFQYKIETQEKLDGFDDPNFIVKVNDRYAFHDFSESGVWNQGFINLKNFNSNNNHFVVNFFSQNSFDEMDPPSLMLKEISTSKFLAKIGDQIAFEALPSNSKIFVKYKSNNEGKIIQHHYQILSPYILKINDAFENDLIEYYVINSQEKVEESKFLVVKVDLNSPKNLERAELFAEGDLQLNIIFDYPSKESNLQNVNQIFNSKNSYQIRVSDDDILSEENWKKSKVIAISNHKKYQDSQMIINPDHNENILIDNLDLGNKYFAIKFFDQAGNYSPIYNLGYINIY
ncbi:MAG: hypothetical protein H6772_00885 [Pseudomonadales bacterium]|nr:hypothetical protein [Pseudomonadales bacterium]